MAALMPMDILLPLKTVWVLTMKMVFILVGKDLLLVVKSV
uniref:Uncharacterized protein n=1 Tax=Arundo donax TaxID=35708 RepID=A0A0A9DZC1_ARUDO